MKSFLEWTMIEAKIASKKKKNSIVHSDIDRWLKSVNDLAQDLKDLQTAKDKSKDKMNQIGKKYKPEEEPKDSKEEPEQEEPKELTPKNTEPEVKPEMEFKKPKRVANSFNAEERQDVKPIKRKPKIKINDKE